MHNGYSDHKSGVPQVQSLPLIHLPLLLFTFLQTTITLHTIHLTLCFQQTGETDNLTVRWGKVLSLCCAGFQVASNTFESFPSSYWFDNLGFLLRKKLLAVLIIPSSWGFPMKLYSDLSRINPFSGAVSEEAKDGF